MSQSPVQQRPAMLAGLKVIDLTRNLPGPFASLMLADMGADVVKVEPPQGDEARFMPPLFEAVNRNKTSIRLDIKKPDELAQLRQLIEGADVLIEGFRPGVLAQSGLTYESLSAANPRLVMCSITGYGQEGSWAHKAGHDMNYMALTGALDQMKLPSGDIPLPNIQIADLLGGSAMGVIGILAGVVDAKMTGQGRYVDVAMTDGVLANMLGANAFNQLLKPMLGRLPGPGESFLNGALPCYNLYRTADARHLAVGALEFKFWKVACTVFDKPQWVDQHWQMGLMPNSPECAALKGEVAAHIASKTLHEWAALFAQADACVTPVLTMEEAFEQAPMKDRRHMFHIVGESSGQPLYHFGLPIRFSHFEFQIKSAAPQ